MIIQCDKCQTKFRLDDSKVSGAGVKVRCTKCQNVFVVRPPGFETPAEQPPAPQAGTQKEAAKGPEAGFEGAAQPPAGAGFEPGAQQDFSAGGGFGGGGTVDFKFGDESGQPAAGGYGEFDFSAGAQGQGAEPSAETSGGEAAFDAGGFQEGFGGGEGFSLEKPSEGPSVAPPPPMDFGFGSIPSEPEMPPAPEEKAPAPPAGGESGEFEFKTDESMTPEQKAADEALKEALAGMTHPPGEEGAGGAEAGESLKESLTAEDKKIHDKEDAGKRAARPAREGMGAIIAAVIIIIVAAAVYFTGAVQSLKNVVSPAPPAARAVDVEAVSGYFVDNKNIGRIFVIEATIRNTTGSPQNVSSVAGSVFGPKGEKLASRSGSPGRVVSKDDLKNLSKDDLSRAFRDMAGGVVPGRASVPVMIVFTETPSNMEEYGIEVK